MGKIHDDWTPEDAAILGRLTLARKLVLLPMIRKGDRYGHDGDYAFAAAISRGASPLEIMRNIMRYETENPEDCIGRVGASECSCCGEYMPAGRSFCCTDEFPEPGEMRETGP
jgi:hypothetical protein